MSDTQTLLPYIATLVESKPLTQSVSVGKLPRHPPFPLREVEGAQLCRRPRVVQIGDYFSQGLPLQVLVRCLHDESSLDFLETI